MKLQKRMHLTLDGTNERRMDLVLSGNVLLLENENENEKEKKKKMNEASLNVLICLRILSMNSWIKTFNEKSESMRMDSDLLVLIKLS